jgi:hypothetical protein
LLGPTAEKIMWISWIFFPFSVGLSKKLNKKNNNSAELLLKLVISAELLIKQKRTDSTLLNKLLAKKKIFSFSVA